MTKTLWRAATDDHLCGPHAFAARQSVARAYMDNGAFGGARLFRATAEIDTAKVLDVFGLARSRQLAAVVEAAGLGHPGAIGADEWVMLQTTADALIAAGYCWVRQLAEGHLMHPFGEPCEGWSWKTGCPGHATADAVEESRS